MWHLLRKTNGNPHQIIMDPLNGLIHMEATPLRMLSLLRRTVNNSNNRLNVTPRQSQSYVIAPQSSRRRRPLPHRQVLPRTQAFRASRTFAQPELSAQRPRLFGNPQIHPPGLWNPPSSTPTGFPSYTRTSLLETNMFLLYFQTQFRHCFHVNKHIQM